MEMKIEMKTKIFTNLNDADELWETIARMPFIGPTLTLEILEYLY